MSKRRPDYAALQEVEFWRTQYRARGTQLTPDFENLTGLNLPLHLHEPGVWTAALAVRHLPISARSLLEFFAQNAGNDALPRWRIAPGVMLNATGIIPTRRPGPGRPPNVLKAVEAALRKQSPETRRSGRVRRAFGLVAWDMQQTDPEAPKSALGIVEHLCRQVWIPDQLTCLDDRTLREAVELTVDCVKAGEVLPFRH